MRQSIGMSQQLNLIIIFILIVFGLIAASLSYYKAFKINNVIVNSIEKYEGYNDSAKTKIQNDLSSLGYQRYSVNCGESSLSSGNDGYCVYLDKISKESGVVKSYNYRITTYMYIDLPIMDLLKIPINASTTQIACISGGCKSLR